MRVPPEVRRRPAAKWRAARTGSLLAWAWLLVAATPVEAPAPIPLLVAEDARELTIEELLADPPAFRFPRGERVEFEVRYLGIPVGSATKEVVRVFAWQGRRIAHVVGTARTNAFFSALFKVDDQAEAWIDIDSFRTLQTATRTRHGRRRQVYEEVAFDWETRFVHVLEDKRWKRTREFSLDFGPDIYDTIEAVYAVRSMPLETGAAIEIPVYASFKVYGLGVPPGDTSEIESDLLGAVRAIRLRPNYTLDGEAQGDGSGEVWFAADGRRVPLRVRGWMRPYTGVRIGGISADVVAYEPGEPEWDALPLLAIEPRVGVAPSERGKPSWRVPGPIREVRREVGIDSIDRRHPELRMESIAACGSLPMLKRFFATPGEPGFGGQCDSPEGLSDSDEGTRSAGGQSS